MPITLAFLGFPQLIVSLFFAGRIATMPQTMADLQSFSLALPWWWTPVLVAMLLVSSVGALALMALALVPRISVREALLLAFRRFPFWLAAAILLFAGLLIALMAVMIFVGLLGGGEFLAVGFTFVVMLGGMLFAALLLPILAERQIAPITLVREGARLYRSSWGRIIAGMLLYLIVAWVVMMALQVSVGSMILLFSRMMGFGEIGILLAAIVASLISAIAWAGFTLMVAGIYRQASAA